MKVGGWGLCVGGGGQYYTGDTCSTFVLYFVKHHVKDVLCVCVSNGNESTCRMFGGRD